MATTTSEPSIAQIEQARISIRNGWTHGCREQRRREAHARLDWLAGLLKQQISSEARSEDRETRELCTVQIQER
jgi:hypothetical protein